ncbi:MAG: pirin family protein [Methylococcales bacterium]|nr:pirin family protein [Methylococcales bacterium]
MTTRIETENTVLHSRQVEQILTGIATSDGAGVKLTRLLDHELQARLDPFLMLDAFNNDKAEDYIAGFPNHPHRGFETLTYLLAGRMRHSDNAGHHGVLESGGIQWMCAGQGIIHSEMPEQRDGLLAGFQLWINLPAEHKMQAPWYRDVQNNEIPEYVSLQGALVRIIAGHSQGMAGAIQRPVTQPLFLDLHFADSTAFSQPLPAEHNAFIYVYSGEVSVAGQDIAANSMAILTTAAADDGVIVQAGRSSRIILVAGAPLHEPIVQHGPFVMNTRQEIAQAIEDFKVGRF